MSDQHHRREGQPRVRSEASRIAELRGHEERLEALRARRTDLEVERIVAAAALRAAPAGAGPEASGATAAEIVDALDRLRRTESRHRAHLAFLESGVRSHGDLLERLRTGDDALRAWLEADREEAGAASGRRIARRALLGACLAILALAFMVHLAFLVLLVPVGGAMSFLLWTGQDRAWRRVGARRRFERLRLEPPAAWTDDAVRERRRSLAGVAEQVRERASAPRPEVPDEEGDDVGAALDAARSELHDALASAGLAPDELDTSAEAALRARARAWRAEQALDGVVEDMAGESAVAGEIRESLYRRLARDGGAAPDGDASADALESGIERTRGRPTTRGGRPSGTAPDGADHRSD